MVELFTADALRPSPAFVIKPVPFVTEGELPTQARLKEPHRCGPSSPWTGFSPALYQDGLEQQSEVFPCRPPSGRTPLDRTTRLLHRLVPSPLQRERETEVGLLGRASIEPDKRLSSHPALRAWAQTGELVKLSEPLAWWATRFTGRALLSGERKPCNPCEADDHRTYPHPAPPRLAHFRFQITFVLRFASSRPHRFQASGNLFSG